MGRADCLAKEPFRPKSELVRNVKDYGAIGNGIADDTAAMQAAINSAPTGSTLYFPGGTYRVNTALSIPSYLTLRGEGYLSRIDWRGTGTWVTLASKTQVKFRNLRVHLYSATAVGIGLSNSFRCSLTGVIIEGELLASTGASYRTQKGIILRDHAGDNRFIDCDLNNLGLGIETQTAQNYVSGCTIGSCWRSISGGTQPE